MRARVLVARLLLLSILILIIIIVIVKIISPSIIINLNNIVFDYGEALGHPSLVNYLWLKFCFIHVMLSITDMS